MLMTSVVMVVSDGGYGDADSSEARDFNLPTNHAF